MKSVKIMLLLLLGAILIGNAGCGGGVGGVADDGDTDESVAMIVEKILTPGTDGAPAVFDYAPRPESYDWNAEADPQKVHFVKYISSRDLNSDNEFIKTIRLNQGSEYVVKYSHGGRILNDSMLGLRIAAPDGREMILDLLSLGSPDVSEDVISGEPLDLSTMTEDEIQKILAENGLTLEELESEIALYNESQEEETPEPIYVNTDLEIIPGENPCITLYRFKAPMTGEYEFAVSELAMNASGDIVKNSSPEVPFEFRIYGINEAHSVFDNEEIEIAPADILDIQRILLYSATEFNENGLPTDFELDDEAEIGTAGVDSPIYPSSAVLPEHAEQIRQKLKKTYPTYTIINGKVIPAAVIDKVPYDDLFEEGAGFYAHSGLRAVTNVIDDEAFSRSALRKFTAPKPGSGDALAVKEKLNVNVIATEEEHDRSAQLEGMSSFVLLRDAFGRSPRKDYARLGSGHTRIISVRYELAEESPRMVDPKEFRLLDEALDNLKEKGAEAFTKNFGDYFVAGYTWGLRYDATVEITTEPGKSYFSRVFFRYNRGFDDEWDAGRLCDMVSELVKTILDNAMANAVSERDTGKSLQDAKDKMENALKSLEKNFHNITLKVSHCKRTGTGGEMSFTVREFANSLADFIKSSKGVEKAKYEQLYVTLRRFREIEAARQYIPETLRVGADLYESIRKLTEKIFRTRCYYNALMAIHPSQLMGGKGLQDGWEKEFEAELVNKVDKGLNYVCADIKRVQEYHDKFDKLYQKYKALAERYNFYCYFMNFQRSWESDSPSWNDSDDERDLDYSIGFREYTRSKLVQEDMKAGGSKYHRHEEPWNKGPRGADFIGTYKNDRVYWYRTGCHDTNHSKGRDVNGKTIGKSSYHWRYDGAGSRRLEVYLELKFVNMPDDKYPFVGLE